MGGGYAKAQSPCAGASVTQTFCTSNVTLTSPSDVNYEYDWYTYTACQGLTGMAYTETINNLNATLNDGEHCFRYEAVNKNITPRPSPTCSTEVLAKIFTGQIQASSNTLNSTSTLTIVYSGNSSFPNISSYQWYRNGAAIIGASNSSFIAELPGNYYLITVSSCGTKTSNTISFCEGSNSQTTYTNHTFSTGITNLSGEIVFEGEIIIPPGADVVIDNAIIYMKSNSQTGCAKIIVENNLNNTQYFGGSLNINDTKIASCSNWLGIFARGVQSLANSTSSGKLIFTNSEIRDADIAIYADQNAVLTINNSIFQENYSHIQFNHFEGINFQHGVEIDINHCQFNKLRNGTSSCNLPNFVLNPLNSSFRPMVYLYNFSNIKISDCDFECINYANSKDQIAIEAIQISDGIGGWDGFNVSDCDINGQLNTGIYISDASKTKIGNNSNHGNNISGDFINGISVFNGNECTIQYNNIICNTPNNGKGGTGLLIDQTLNAVIKNNDMENFTYGMEYYINQNILTNAISSLVTLNTFSTNNFGIVFAPECNPINNSNCNSNYYSNTSNSSIKFDCNKIIYNDWGFVGVGDLVDQGDQNAEWGTFFYNSNQNQSTNSNADIVWYNNNTFINFNSYSILTFQQNTSLGLDGNNITNSNNEVNRISIQNPNSCYQSFKPVNSPFYNLDTLNNLDYKIYPNPCVDILNIETIKSDDINIRIVDVLGRVKYDNNNTKVNSINLSNYIDGIYYLVITNISSNKIIEIRKLIKLK